MHVLSFNQFPSVYAPRLGLSIILCLTELQQMLNCPICKLSMQEQYFASHRSSSQRNQTIIIFIAAVFFVQYRSTWGLLQDDRPVCIYEQIFISELSSCMQNLSGHLICYYGITPQRIFISDQLRILNFLASRPGCLFIYLLYIITIYEKALLVACGKCCCQLCCPIREIDFQ